MAWLKLIRWKNLAIILLTQFLVWWCVILPEVPLVLKPVNFLLLALSTALIAAAGYIINDYFDIKIDLINRPEKVVLEKVIPRKQAIISHTVLNIAALLCAGYVAAYAHSYEWLLVQVLCTLLLWFYSTDFKRQYITGNLAVALLAALTIIVLMVYEPALHHTLNTLPVWVLGIYAYFAFMLTWMREIVKDMEDFIGDESEGCVTMPIKRGLNFAARYTLGLSLLVVIPLLIAAKVLYQNSYIILSLYVLILLVLPLIIWSLFLNKDSSTQHYSKASRLLKIIMLLGVFSLVVYHFQLNSFKQ